MSAAAIGDQQGLVWDAGLGAFVPASLVKSSTVGQAGGPAGPLDSGGLIPAAQVPGGGGSTSPATTGALGTVKLSHAPSDPANPVAVENTDPRNSDTRTPTDATVTDAKVAAGAAIAESKLALASDAAAGTASRRTLGSGATQAAAGNDSRITGAAQVGSVERFAPAATGTAATDTANLQAAISATPAGGTLFLDGHYKINAALSVTQAITLAGRQKVTYTGLGALPSGPNALTQVQGSIIEQTVAATDAIDVTVSGQAFHMRDIVCAFTSGLASTGHGINCDPGSAVVGLYGATFDGCYVFGHDGNHYALRIWNALEYTTRDFRSWGGGGIIEGCTAGTINYGNAVHIHPYVSLVNAGSAHGFARSSAAGTTVPASGGMLNLMTYIRPQCNIAGAAGTQGTQKMWTDSVGAGFPWFVTVVSADLEASGFGDWYDYGPDTNFVGTFDVAANGTNPGNESVGYLALAAAGQNTTTQQKSVAFGRQALQSLTTGSAAVAVGYFALQSATGSLNTAVGYTAGQAVVAGQAGVFIGNAAGFKGAGTAGNSTIASNYATAVGYQAGPGSTGDPASYVALGKNATVGSTASGAGIGLYGIAIGAGVAAQFNGSVALGVDHNGLAATAAAQDEIALGVANHQVKISNNTTGAGSAALGANCPAVTATAPYTWFKMKSSDGSTVYVPAWK